MAVIRSLRGALILAFFIACNPLPRDTTTLVDFEVDEGTRLAFDISPDGKSIVFDLLGQLWLVPADGGSASPLTDAVRDTSEDVDPAFSPDGQWIVFQSDRGGTRGLWRVRVTGGEPQPITAPDMHVGSNWHLGPAWAPNSREVVFGDNSETEGLVVIDVESGDSRPVPLAPAEATTEFERIGSPAWSADGRRIAFGTSGALAFGLWIGAESRIWEVSASGGTATPLTAAGVRAVSPAYTADGTRIAFFSPDSAGRWQLWVQSLPRGSPRQLTDQEDVSIRRARWFPGDGEILYSADGKLWRIDETGGPPTSVPFTARVRFERRVPKLSAVRFPEPGTEQPARGFYGLALSPQGDRIAMVALGKLWIWVPESPPISIPTAPGILSAVSWSPDGTQLLIGASRDLFVTDLSSGETRQLTALDRAERDAAWSPDGTWIAFKHRGSLRVVRAESGVIDEADQTIDLGSVPGKPVWNPDSRSLMLHEASAESRPVLVPLDGGELRPVSRFPDATAFVHWTEPFGISYVQGNRIWRTPFDDSTETAGDPTLVSDVAALYLSVAADGSMLYVTPNGLEIRDTDDSVETLGWPLTYRVPTAPPPLLITNVRVMDGTGTGPSPLSDLLLSNGRIERIAGAGTIDMTDQTQVLDAEGRTVTPGLIDLHTHLWGNVPGRGGSLYHGVTTSRDVGSDMAKTAAHHDLVAAGLHPSSRIVYGGFFFGGSDGVTTGRYQNIADPGDVVRAMEFARTFGAHYVKNYAWSYWGASATTVMEAHRHGLRTSGHCTHLLPVVAAGIDGREHAGQCLRDMGVIYDDLVQLTRAADLWVVPTVGFPLSYLRRIDSTLVYRPDVAPFLGGSPDRYVTPPGRRAQWQRSAAVFRAATEKLHQAGVRLATGTDGILPVDIHLELEALVEAGLSPAEALAAATSVAARALGAQDEIGTIAEGMWADLVIYDADPLEDITNSQHIWQVIQGGRVVDRPALLDRARKYD